MSKQAYKLKYSNYKICQAKHGDIFYSSQFDQRYRIVCPSCLEKPHILNLPFDGIIKTGSKLSMYGYNSHKALKMESNVNITSEAVGRENVGEDIVNSDVTLNEQVKTAENLECVHISPSSTMNFEKTAIGEHKSLEKKQNCNSSKIISTRQNYFTIPSIDEINLRRNADDSHLVRELTIGCTDYGCIYFPGDTEVSNLNLDATVFFQHKEITVYPDNSTDKPSCGEGLNRSAVVTLYNVFPTSCGNVIKDLETLTSFEYAEKLKESCVRQGCEFVKYNAGEGSWVFEVLHFSKYGVDFDDEVGATGLDNQMRTEKRSAVEEKPTSIETKKVVVRSDEKATSQDILEMKHGLGGHDYVQDGKEMMEVNFSLGGHDYIRDGTSVLDLSTKVYREELLPKRNIELLRHALYDAEHDISKDSSSYLYNMMERDEDKNMQEPFFSDLPSYIDQPPPPRRPLYSVPKIFVLQNVSGKVPPEKSLLRGLRCCKDLNIFKGESFRCGWMKGFKHITLGDEIYLGRHSTSILHIRDIAVRDEPVDDFIIPTLTTVHSETTHEVDSYGCPTFKMNIGSSYLIKQTELFRSLLDSPEYNGSIKYFSSVWELCYALWAPLIDEKDLRKDYVSKWLRQTVHKQVVDPWLIAHGQNMSFEELTNVVLELLSINNILDAAEVLMLNKCPQLSMLVSQLSATNHFQNLLSEQLVFWYNSMAEEFIPLEMKKIYLLLSGNATFGEVNVCENLDWKRAFGMHLWYIAPSHAPLHEAVRIYKEAFDSENAYAEKPLPPYLSSTALSSTHDILYHILTLYCSRVYVLNHVLDPATHTKDPLDYRMSWLLLQLFKSLQIGVIDEMSENMLTLSFAHQLEDLNQWQWAIFVLLFMKDNALKKKHVMGILERNLSLEVNEETDKIDDVLVNEMKVPARWIHEVKAYKAEHLQMHWLSYAHFAHAGNYYKSNDIFVTHLLSDLVVNESFDTLKQAVALLLPYKDKILSWCYEIGLVLDFLELQQKFEAVEDESDLLRLHAALVTLVRRLPQFPLKNNLQKLCIAEISRKCALLQRVLVERVTDPSFKHSFIQVLDHLVMPPDYVFTEGLYYFLKLME